MNRPGSVLAAGAVGVIAAAAVLGNLTLASCESGSGWRSTRRSTTGSTATSSTKGTQVSTPSTLPQPSVSPAPATPPPSGTGAIGGVPTAEPEIRVRIQAAAGSAMLSSATGLEFAPAAADQFNLSAAPGATILLRGQNTISIEGGSWIIGTARLPASVPVVVTPVGVSKQVMINGQAYPGRLRLTVRSDMSGAHGAFDIVEFVPIEEYLPGVVAKEMLPNWHPEAYRVQAVCARTYALHERARSIAAGQAFDVESSDRDQMYAGATSNSVVLDAVRSTRGQVLTFEGKVLRAYFSSTCGGRTASARDTWPIGPGYEYNLAAPLQARQREFACQQSPLYRWQVTRNRRELAARIRTFGERSGLLVKQLGEVATIETVEFNPDGRPSRFRVVEPGGRWFQLSGEEFRLACNTSASMSGRGSGGSAAGGAVSSLVTPAFAAVGPTNPRVPNVMLPEISRATRVNSSDLEVRIRGDQVVISGRGFGHGVGMCQFCAKGFAERGERWQTMVLRFYPGASIEKAY